MNSRRSTAEERGRVFRRCRWETSGGGDIERAINEFCWRTATEPLSNEGWKRHCGDERIQLSCRGQFSAGWCRAKVPGRRPATGRRSR